MTTNSNHPSTLVQLVNGLVALALAVFILANYWPTVRLFNLSRADLQCQGDWVDGYARRITSVTPGGVADRAGLKAGDVLEFDPGRGADWVLAGYREMPAGFSATLSVRHIDGSRTVVLLKPERIEYFPDLNDRLAYIARLAGLTILLLVGTFLVWARPSLMTWSLLLGAMSIAPARPWGAYFLAYRATVPIFDQIAVAPVWAMMLIFGFPSFALCFPRGTLTDWPWWKRVLGLAFVLAFVLYFGRQNRIAPFTLDWTKPRELVVGFAAATFLVLIAIAALWRTYRTAAQSERPRLKWATLGITGVFFALGHALVFGAMPFQLSSGLSISPLTPSNWLFGLCTGIFLPLALGVAVLRERVVDIQFAISRTLVYGAVTTIVLVFLAAVHWVLGKLIELSHLAIGLEGLAAIGLGLVLHRATHTINQLVDRVLFRRHHAAEERLRRVIAALPFATDERSIAEALVTEPVRNLELASAALFYRESGEGPFRRVLTHGWSDEHVTRLDGDMFLVRYLQAEHEPLSIDEADLLPQQVPQGAGFPVLAVPIVNQHALTALVLYGAHTNSTLPDPDEVTLLTKLAEAAAVSHSQVRMAMLQRRNAALAQEVSTLAGANEAQQKIIGRIEAALARDARPTS